MENKCFCCYEVPEVPKKFEGFIICGDCNAKLQTHMFVFCIKCQTTAFWEYHEDKVKAICAVNTTPKGAGMEVVAEDVVLMTAFNTMVTLAVNTGQRMFPIKKCRWCPPRKGCTDCTC